MRPVLLAFFALTAFAGAQSRIDSWIRFDFAHNRIAAQQLKGLNQEDLAKIRGIVFGRHGRVFIDPEIREFLDSQSWYKQNPKFSNAMLNATERANLDVIRGAEAAQHKSIVPGDLRFWSNRIINRQNLGNPRLIDVHVMACEIEAIHGRAFRDEPSMQQYFAARYWYAPSRYNPMSLNPTERANLAFLRKAEAEKRKSPIAPGDMAAFDDVLIRPDQLSGIGLYDLRLLRNEIYARKGYHFYTQWLLDHFSGEEWYQPLPKGKEPKLTKIEEENVAMILKQESKLHEGLTTSKIQPSELDELYAEDARKLRLEIQARHGKVFKDPWLSSYFKSLPWYKPNPSYSDKMLSRLERENIAQIKKYEAHADSEFHSVEG